MIRKLIELLMTTGLPLLLCTGGIYGVFFIGPMSDIPSKDQLRKVRGQITLIKYEQHNDSPNIQFYIAGTPEPFLIRSDMGYLPQLATRLNQAKSNAQTVTIDYTLSQHTLIQGQILTLNHPWQIDILAPSSRPTARSVEAQLLNYDDMVQVQKDDNQDMYWLGVLALLSGVTSLASVLYRRRAGIAQTAWSMDTKSHL